VFWWEFGLSSASRNHITTFCRPSLHYACLRLCSAIVHFIRINCLYFVCYGWSAQALTALATLAISVAWYCCTSTKTAFFNIEAFRNLITPQREKGKRIVCWTSTQSHRHGGLWWAQPLQTKLQSPPNWNMKHYILVEFMSNLNVEPPLHERKASLLTTFWRRFCFYT